MTMLDDPVLRGLNPAQREAVAAVAGPLLIIAGPGSGKTRVISHRVAYLIRTLGVSPRRIVAVTFTNKAARELRERIERLIGASVEHLTAGTFHAICARMLRSDGPALGIDPHFQIFDEEDQLRVMKGVLADLRLDEGRISPRAVLNAISRLKAELVLPDSPELSGIQRYFDEIVSRAYRLYQERLAESRGLDFDDLILQTVRLLSEVPTVATRYQERYLHILVDEFQDTNIAQYELVKLLAARHRNLTVVGDPDQSIYRFRSADLRNILNFERDFPDARVVVLEENYRSTQQILSAAAGIIAPNRGRKPKQLVAVRGEGPKIIVRELANEHDEAAAVAREIEQLRQAEQRRFRDFAVMYRTNAQSRPLEQRLVLHGIPYRLVGGVRFYERREVKDLLAYLRLALNPRDLIALERVINVPPRSIGQRTLDELVRLSRAQEQPLWETLLAIQVGALTVSPRARGPLLGFVATIQDLIAASAELPPPALIERVLERTGYRDYLQPESEEGAERLENIQQLMTAANEFASFSPREALARFLDEVSLFTDIDQADLAADAVTLITLHAAKGLEFPVVFIVGLEEGILPHARAIAGEEDDLEALEEERRLLYVGVTRAKERLFLFHAYRRGMWGRSEALPRSRFLDDIPPEVREKEQIVISQGSFPLPTVRAAGLPERLPFGPGDYVRQALLGEGQVVAVNPVRGDYEVIVNFRNPRAGVKKLLQSLARLEKIER
jgi:DNA helicase-2/ATP-dependent DNA helicase PcrA